MYPVLCSVTLRGLSGALRHSVFCFACAPLRGLGSSQNKFENRGKERRSNFFRAPPRKQTFGTWEPGPLARFAQCDPSKNGKFNKRRHYHVPEQSHPHRLPRQRRRSSHQQQTAASRHSRWQPSPPTRRTASTSRTPNGTVASSSASSRSSPRRSRRALISRSKASCAAASTTARRRTRSSASGRFGSLRS